MRQSWRSRGWSGPGRFAPRDEAEFDVDRGEGIIESFQLKTEQSNGQMNLGQFGSVLCSLLKSGQSQIIFLLNCVLLSKGLLQPGGVRIKLRNLLVRPAGQFHPGSAELIGVLGLLGSQLREFLKL